MIAGLVFLLLLAGCFAIACSMPRHYRDVFQSPLSGRRKMILRIFAYLMLLASLVGAYAGEEGGELGLTFWFGMATVVALIVAFTLTYLVSARRTAQCSKARMISASISVNTPNKQR